jgi:MFS family permease
VRAARVLANPDFRRVWLAQGISVFGDYLAMFAVQAAIVFRLRGSARMVSGMLMASLLTGVVIGLVAGVFADRWNPRRTMVASDFLRAVLVLLLVTSNRFSYICAICFAIGCFSAFFVPAQAVVIPRLVEREELLAASALMQQTLQVARIASPAVAGALVAHFGENACYAADAASFVLSAALLARIRCHGTTRNTTKNTTKCTTETCEKALPKKVVTRLLREFREGVRFVFASSELSFATLSMAGGTFAAGCYSALAGIYVRDVLHAGTAVYGAMGSLTAVGTFAGAVLIGHKAIGRIARNGEREILIAAGMGVVGACILLLAAFPAALVTMIATLGIGLGAAVALVAASAMIRERAPVELRGRVSSVSLSLMSAAQAGAILVAGSCAGSIAGGAGRGVRGVYALSGAMLLAQPAYRYFRRGTIRSAPAACFQTPP